MLKSLFKKKEVQDEDGEVIVKVSENELKASIYVKGPTGVGYEPTMYDAYNVIKKKGITFGLDDNLLLKIFENKAFNREFVIAKGKKFIPTKQGKIKYYFKINPDLKPLEDKKGNLDYKNVKLIQNVNKGDKLCEFIPPEKGTPGKTVTGKKIQPEDIREIKIPSGVNIEKDPNNENIIISSMDGTVRKFADIIEVNPVLLIKSDIDFSTGNIESHIPTKIIGDVRSTFSVNVKKDLEVNGIIEDAEIYAGGGIVAKSGIIGKKNGKIVAEGNISAMNCQKMTLISRKDIILNERVSDSMIIADGKIKIKSRRSEIMRCKIIAKDGVEVRNIGNDNYEPVDVIIGMPGEFFLERESLSVRLRQLKEAVDRAGKSIKLAHKMQAFKGGVTKARKDTILKLQQNYSELMKQLNDIKEKKERIDVEIKNKMNKNASFIVFSKIFPKVKINICDKKIMTTEENSLIEYKYSDEEIIEIDLKEKYSKLEIQRMMLRG